jgi:transposase
MGLTRLLGHLSLLSTQVKEIYERVQEWHRSTEASRRLEKMPSIGPITASTLVATVGDPKNFDNGHQLAAWLGLDPRQHSGSGRPTMLSMSKRGDPYLWTMLNHRARSVIYRATQKAKPQK